MLKLSTSYMARLFIILAVVCASFVYTGCGEKTDAQKNDDLRESIRETKRQEAAKNYKILATQFPEHEHAGEAQRKASELEAKKK